MDLEGAYFFWGQDTPSCLRHIPETIYLFLALPGLLELALFFWFGRAAIIKMSILPELLYIMQAAPPSILFRIFKVNDLCIHLAKLSGED